MRAFGDGGLAEADVAATLALFGGGNFAFR